VFVFALLRTRRWQSFTVLVLVAIVAFGLLSRWQWSRAEEKRQEQQLIVDAQRVPTDIGQAAEPWQLVRFAGEFDATSTRFVRQRPMSGANGVWVMTALRTAAGEMVWVNRGWVPAARSASDLPQAPPPPSGIVAVEGHWVPFDDTTPQPGLPDGLIPGVSPETLPVAPTYDGFVHAYTPISSEMLSVGPPEINEGQNISYAMQWLAFAFVACAGWFIMLRREARDHVPAN
jgi:cytochrome oxidase assembly protein ShyY1